MTHDKNRVSRSSSSSSIMPFYLLLPSVLLLLTVFPSYTDATKHTFKTRRDHRTFIGPIGAPFGFFEKGTYKLTVSDFKLAIKDHHRSGSKNKKSSNSKNNQDDSSQQDEYLEKLHPGFLLKRFENENEFAYFQESIYDNVTTCGFSDFIHGGNYALDDDGNINIHDKPNNNINAAAVAADDDDYYNKDTNSNYRSIGDDDVDIFVAKGPGVIDGGQDGIFLSMKNKEYMWQPQTPSLEHVFTVGETGFYFLFYQICLPDFNNNQGTSSSSTAIGDISKYIFKEVTSNFKLDFEYTNVDSFGNISYLTAGDMPLPHIYLYFTISYLILLIMWLQSMNGNRDESGNGRKPTIYAIHHLMSSVVFLKVITMLLESIRYHFIRVKGHAEIWSFVYYLTNFLKGTFLFIVILLIGSGWSFFKPHLSVKERRILLFVVALQIIDNIAVGMLAFETENERLYNDWSTILHLVDIVSCCALLLPIVWQVNSLEESVEVGSGTTTNESDEDNNNQDVEGLGIPVEETTTSAPSSTNPSSSRLQSKLHLFRSFYLIVVGYIYFTRIVIYLFASSLKYNQTWIRVFVYELGTLTFYFIVGMKFKPVDESIYYSNVRVHDGEDTDGFEDNFDDDGVDDISALLPQNQKSAQQKQIELSNVMTGGKTKIAQD